MKHNNKKNVNHYETTVAKNRKVKWLNKTYVY